MDGADPRTASRPTETAIKKEGEMEQIERDIKRAKAGGWYGKVEDALIFPFEALFWILMMPVIVGYAIVFMIMDVLGISMGLVKKVRREL